MVMSKDIRFSIESLQRSKIIMACEAVAVNTSVMIGIYLVDRFLGDNPFSRGLILVGGLFGIAYALYASFGNLKKHREIRDLESKL